jgi:hypothetical protein
MDQKICYLILLFTLIFATSQISFAAGGGSKKPWATSFGLGYTSQDFKGDETAAFSKIQHYVIDFKFQWYRKWYSLGFAYSSIPSINISPFLLTTGEKGNYKLSFSQMFLLVGATYKLMYFNLLIGTESTQWSGSPNMGLKGASHALTGIEIGCDAYKMKNFGFPVWLRFLSKPQRNMEFQNYTNDTITVNSGVELVLAGSVKFEF